MRPDCSNPVRLTAAERRIVVVEMRKDGYTVREIGRYLGISHNAVHKHELKALAELARRQDDATKGYRALQVQTLEAQLKRMTVVAKDPQAGVVSQIAAENTLLKINERLSKLTGTDAPLRIESKSEIAHDLTPDQLKRMASLFKESVGIDGTEPA